MGWQCRQRADSIQPAAGGWFRGRRHQRRTRRFELSCTGGQPPLVPPSLPPPTYQQKARKVYVLLHKEADAEWRFLKG